jgi:hypothetical protein
MGSGVSEASVSLSLSSTSPSMGSSRPSHAAIGANSELRMMHDYPHDPVEVFNRAADIFRMAGHMLGQRLQSVETEISFSARIGRSCEN